MRWLAWRVDGSIAYRTSRRHLLAAAVLVVTGAAAAVLAFVLVVVPLLDAVGQVPGDLGRAYVSYFNGVGQQFRQACEQQHGQDCQQYGGTP